MFPGLLLYRPRDARSSGAQKNRYCNPSICKVLYGFQSVFHLTYSEFSFFFLLIIMRGKKGSGVYFSGRGVKE